MSTAARRTFVYRGCPYIKVDVDFQATDPAKTAEEHAADIIKKVSTPYLAHSIID